MKYTALVREVVTREIRVVVHADSKGSAKRVLTLMCGTHSHCNGIVAKKDIVVSPLLDSIEPITPEVIDRVQKELRA